MLLNPLTGSERHFRGRKLSLEPSCTRQCSCHQWFAVGGGSVHWAKKAGTLAESHHLRTAGNNLTFPTLWSLSFAVMHLFCSLSLFSSFAVGATSPHFPPPPCQHHDILGLCGILTFHSCWEINYLSTFEMMVEEHHDVATAWLVIPSLFFIFAYFCIFLSFQSEFNHFIHLTRWQHIRQTPALNLIQLLYGHHRYKAVGLQWVVDVIDDVYVIDSSTRNFNRWRVAVNCLIRPLHARLYKRISKFLHAMVPEYFMRAVNNATVKTVVFLSPFDWTTLRLRQHGAFAWVSSSSD